MAKNIVIFSDGTGQGGGLLPDENRSNVYKLFRATRVCPDTSINPSEQIAFYDPGLGSQAAASGIRFSWWRRIYNVLSSATGLGITRNIIDCYAAIIRVWEPGDRLYLVGFSRGAYTIRCVAGVLSLCGVPTRLGPDQPLKRDLKSANAIATQAVKRVYQFGASIKGDPYKGVRIELADRFRTQHASAAPDNSSLSNAYPYFIGVWDTVATLGLTAGRTLALGTGLVLGIGLIAVVGSLLGTWLLGETFNADTYWSFFAALCGVAALAGLVAYLITYVKFTTESSKPWWETLHLTGWQMQFYDTELSSHVQHARHALAIDENRKDFDRVPWTKGAEVATVTKKDGYEQIKQVWFAGVHSDVGGSYAENEARLSDTALGWMIEEATGLPEPMKVDPAVLQLWPAADGPQHDERKNTVDGWPDWFVRLLTRVWKQEELGWDPWVRTIPRNAPLHPTVLQRFAAREVLHYDMTQPYRPEGLRLHRETHQFYEPSPSAPLPVQAGA